MNPSTKREPTIDCVAPSGPHAPEGVVAKGDHTGITVRWRQRGPVDGWTVYLDAQDGTDVETAFVTEPGHRFGDLAPGDHLVSVIAWSAEQPSPDDDVWVTATVLDPDPGAPLIPVITEMTVSDNTIALEWLSQDAQRWQVQLLDAEHRQLAAHTTADRQTQLNHLGTNAHLGVRVRALGEHGSSPWCEALWVATATE